MQNKRKTEYAQGEKMGRVGERPYAVYLLSILIRAFHQVGAAVFLAVCLLEETPDMPQIYLILAVASGSLLFAVEWMRHRQLFREVSGTVTIVKCLLLGGAFHGFLSQKWTVLLAFLVASVVAHAPKKFRHHLLF